MTLVHIGDGRHIDTEEGPRFSPPPRKKHKICKAHRRYKPEGNTSEELGIQHMSDRYGLKEFADYRQSIISKYRDTGQFVGSGKGITKKNYGYLWGWAKRRARLDMEKIMTAFPDTEAAAAEALEAALTVMRGPQSQVQKLAAAKLVLDFTRAKPTAKSEVTINAAEDWLNSLGKDGNDAD